MKINIFILVLIFLPIEVWAQMSSDEQIQERIENLTSAEHVNITLAWVYRYFLHVELADEIISLRTTENGPTVRLSIVKNREFSHIVKLVGEWIQASDEMSVVQDWTRYDDANVLLIRSNDPIDLLIMFTYHIEKHHMTLFAGENLKGL